jgi:hypothetical protein
VDTPQITPEQALQYAPDDSSIKAAKKLAPAHQWQQLHLHLHSDGCFVLWGDISGSAFITVRFYWARSLIFRVIALALNARANMDLRY